MDEYYQVTTTVADEARAGELADSAVEARLAACAQVDGPITSTYRWQGAIETAREWRITYKTSGMRLTQLIEQIQAAHPYDLPEVIVTPIVAGHPPYLTWLSTETARD